MADEQYEFLRQEDIAWNPSLACVFDKPENIVKRSYYVYLLCHEAI